MGDCKVECDSSNSLSFEQEKKPRGSNTSFSTKFVAKRFPQYFVALAANINGFALGAGWFWSSTGVPGMAKSGDLGDLTKSDRSWITSAPMLGALLACPITAICLNHLGRRNSLLWFSIPGSLSWFIIAFSNSIPVILVARVAVGIFCGLSGIIGPLLIAESVEAPFRGLLMCMFEFAICIGTLYVYIIGSFMDWHIQAIAAAIVPVVGFGVLIFVPESPYYLMEKDDYKGAVKSLCWLRGADAGHLISEEIEEVSQTVKNRRCDAHLSWREVLRDQAVMKPILLSIALMTFFQGTYINVVLNATVEIFQSAGSYDEYFSTILIGVIQIIATLVPMTLSDRIGRRILILVSLVMIVFSLIGLGLYFRLKNIYGESSQFMESISWVPLAALVGYIIACSIGIVPLSWVITAEIAPPKAKGLASGMAGIWGRVVGFAVIFTFWDLIQLLGNDGTYWLIASFNFAAGVVIYFFVPETRGKTLEQIQAHFEKSNTEKATKM
ncbi:facilitated trehalose transporter Tret1 [Folsomia candida]|uniref:Facilitated trehalose transporter Tret1 n=1 Tax=Folsomia candida TaxID=158441 RepID=A0A226E528_FOLCA|nr:facilitated trehalose transporter Tret1 [Folsomia candida]OXA51606.1 Facilitated trehalose transporter Tret1 [Folsomia candida]